MSSSSTLASKLGDKLLNPSTSSETTPTAALEGKESVMLYFSAHWCPPCRRFTPILKEFYNKLKSSNTNMELIFCSLDNSEDQYKEYISDMPWLCMPFQAEQSPWLAQKYGARGIPYLVVLDAKDGNVFTVEGRDMLQMDPEGKQYPWKPKTFSETWPEKVLVKKGVDGQEDTFMASSEFKDKYLMLYFSASWCPPCRQFTPKLAAAYTKLKSLRSDFELVFVSSDREEETFNDYFTKKMNFYALPYEHRDVKQILSKKFGVMGIPTLVMLGPQGQDGDRPLVNHNIGAHIERETFDEFPFHRKKYGDVDYASVLNETQCVIIFGENCDDDEQANIKTVAKEVVKKLKEKDETSEIHVFWAFSAKTTAAKIRPLAKLPPAEKSDDPSMIILDIPDEGGFYKTDETDITVENVLKFIENPGKRLQLE